VDQALRQILEKQGYGLVGEHSGVKVCHWTKSMLTGGAGCYKHQFYGIESHRCLQMTPVVNYCNKTCLYCWRFQGWDDKLAGHWDEPAFIIEESIKQQRRLLSGFKGDPRVSKERFAEALQPRHVAISLTGEPTFYPKLARFIEEMHERGVSTFLVTNGTTPEILAKLDPLPTQLYVSLDSVNEEMFNKLGVPTTKDAWQRVMKTLEILPSLECRKVIRHTIIKGWNMDATAEFAELDKIAKPDFIECKAYEFVGPSRTRMSWDNVPSPEEVATFSEEIAAGTGYGLEDFNRHSRVALVMRPGASRMIDFSAIRAGHGKKTLAPIEVGFETQVAAEGATELPPGVNVTFG
jgi:tRNA wybutosine-synthesizing protein 1